MLKRVCPREYLLETVGLASEEMISWHFCPDGPGTVPTRRKLKLDIINLLLVFLQMLHFNMANTSEEIENGGSENVMFW